MMFRLLCVFALTVCALLPQATFASIPAPADVVLQVRRTVTIRHNAADGTFHVSCPTVESYREFWAGWISNFAASERRTIAEKAPFANWINRYQSTLRCDARVFPKVAPKIIDHLLSQGYSVIATEADLKRLGYFDRD